MAFGVVFVGLPVRFVGHFFVGAVAVGLVLGKPTHANPHRLFLRFDFERFVVGLQDFSHGEEVNPERREVQELAETQPLKRSIRSAQIPILKRQRILLFPEGLTSVRCTGGCQPLTLPRLFLQI